MVSEIQQLKQFFSSNNLKLSELWLEHCVEWLKGQSSQNSLPLDELKKQVYVQWLLTDLNELSLPVLPRDLHKQVKSVLTGTYCLQMMKIVDISKPKLWQLQRIRNEVPKNASTNPEDRESYGNRMLLMTLTDGVQEIEAMEFKFVPVLNVNLKPGTKIEIKGPITVRRNRMMLEAHNVRILGGELAELFVQNAVENILARALKLPENPTPKSIDEKVLEVAENSAINTSRSTSQVHIPPTKPQKPSSNITRETYNSRSPVRNKNVIQLDTLDDDTFNIEDDVLMQAVEQYEEKDNKKDEPRKPEIPPSKSPDLFDDVDFDDLELPSFSTVSPIKNKQHNIVNIKKLQPEINIQNKLLERDETNVPSCSTPKNVPEKYERISNNLPLTSSSVKVWSIQKLKKNLHNISSGKFKIKAKFKKVIEKVTVANNEYHMVITVSDETGELDLSVHTSVVTVLAGHSAEEMMQLKERILQGDQESHREVIKRLSKLRDKLISLNSVMEVQVSKPEKYPLVVNLL